MATAANLPAERRADPLTVFRQTLSQPAFIDQLKMALPRHIPVERFMRVALTAVQTNPDLLNGQKVERHSLFGALVRAAQDALLPDGREGAIVPFRGKAQWMPMVAGIMRKVRNSGEIASWDAFAVFEKDEFERLLGDDMRIYHKPFEEGDPGQVVGAYSIVTFKDGTKSKDYMPRWRIEKARKQGGSNNSLMWTQFYDEGAIKTVIRHHAKRLPMSTDIDAVFDRDETMTPPAGFRPQVVDAIADHVPANRLDALEQHIEAHDADTGEIEPDAPASDDFEQDFGLAEGDDDADSAGEIEAPAWTEPVGKVRAKIEAATDRASWSAADTAFMKISAGLPDDVRTTLDGELQAKRKALAS